MSISFVHMSVEADYNHAGIREVLTFINSSHLKIDIITTKCHSALSPIFKFYGSHVMNAITGRGICCPYPNQTFHGHIMLNLYILVMLSLPIQKALLKHTK